MRSSQITQDEYTYLDSLIKQTKHSMRFLQEKILNDMLDASELEMYMNMTKKEKRNFLKKVHTNQITKREDGRYITSVYPIGKARKQITAYTENELAEKLYTFYIEVLNRDTISSLYDEWIHARLRCGYVDEKTVQRNNQHWLKYYKDTPMVSKPIDEITRNEMRDFLEGLIVEYNLTSKGYRNIKSILNGVFELAVEKEIITTSFMHEIKVRVKCRAVRKKHESLKIYYDDEYELLMDVLKADNSIQSLAIRFMFQVGTRNGESSALKFSDVIENEIYIQRMEKKSVDDNFKATELEVVDYVKKDAVDGYRFIPLTDEAKSIIDQARILNPNGEYIFMIDGVRMTARSFAYWLEYYCQKADIPYRSPHCCRRTFCSRLHNAGMNLEGIRKLMGHADERTTLGYIYDTRRESTNVLLMNKAL